MNTVIEIMNMRSSTITTLTTDIIMTPYSSHTPGSVVVISVVVVGVIDVVLVTPLSVIVVDSVVMKDEFEVVLVGEIVEVILSDIAACLILRLKWLFRLLKLLKF